jgi:3-hydroxyacyl-[acyl-carrier-protein] dehydratase
MIDYVDEVLPGKYARGYKNMTLNEWFFPVHFPGGPNMPGALQLEALAQMLTVAITTLPGLKGKVTHALSHTVRFKKEVLPGEKFEIKTEVISWKRGICKGKGFAYTNGELACEADMLITIPEILEEYLPKKPEKK